jgi:hypothetical protein
VVVEPFDRWGGGRGLWAVDRRTDARVIHPLTLTGSGGFSSWNFIGTNNSTAVPPGGTVVFFVELMNFGEAN